MGFSLTTFAIEIVNFLILLYLLRKLLYRPLQEGIRKRREDLQASRAEVDRQRAQLSEEQKALHEQRQQLDTLRQNVLAEVSQQAAEERDRILTQAREDAASELSRAERLVQSERESARVWVRDQTLGLSTELAGRLLLSLDAVAAENAFFEAVVEAMGGADAPQEAGPLTVEVTCARMPSDTQIERLRQASERLAPNARWRLETDASLQAGCVVRIGSSVFDASLSGRLRTLQERARRLLPEQTSGEEGDRVQP